MKKRSFLFILVLYMAIGFSQSQILISNWQFRKVGDTGGWMAATVPGTVHTDLLSNNKIPDPFYRDNESKIQWVDREDWEYQTNFTTSSLVLQRNHVELVFEGLDTYAEVYLNGTKILDADNMFRTWKVDVKQWLKSTNYLYIKFHSAQNKVEELAQKDLPFAWPTLDYPRMYVRKAQYSFGWDWGPKFTTCGVWKNIKLNAWDYMKVNDVHFTVTSLTDKLATVKATYQIEANESNTVSIHLQDKAAVPAFSVNRTMVLHKGINDVTLDFNVLNPKKWWTYQLGKPYLYTTVSSIQTTVNRATETTDIEKKLGLRTIQLMQEKDEVGQSFYFKLNGIPVYMKGANFIPCNPFLPRITYDTYKKQVANAKEANMNMLRVWGGGIYESDDLYNLCDEEGILVWQDMAFACAMYPDDEAFLKNVQAELADNITRLRNHPSLALYCGSNEVDEGWNNWWRWKFKDKPQEEARIDAAYKKLFLDVIPTTIAQYDNSISFIPSSPLFSWTKKESITNGDSHYWGLWGYEEPAEVFHEKTGRFVSEYGMESMPELSTVEKYALPEDYDTTSATMRTHQKHGKGYPLMQSYINQYMPQPKNFIDYIYATQCMQHYVFSTSIQIHRSKMPTNMGTLYWQLNDCWPVASWSTVDCYNNWKAAMFGIKDAYADVLITLDSTDKKNWAVNVTNDLLKNIPGVLHLSIHDFSGKEYDKIDIPLTAVKQTTTIVDIGNWVSKRTETNGLYAKATFVSVGKTVSETHFTFSTPQNLKLYKPYIQVQPISSTSFSISSNGFAKYVQLNIPGKQVHYSDNYFDLLPNEKKIITIDSAVQELNKKIVVKTLADLF